MSYSEIQDEKLALIQWITQLDNERVLQKLIDIRNTESVIPEWHKEQVFERLKTAGTQDYLTWDSAKLMLR